MFWCRPNDIQLFVFCEFKFKMSMISPQRLKRKYESVTEEDMATSGTFGGSGSTDMTSNYRS